MNMSNDGTPNVQSLIAAVAARHGFLLKPSDAAFALVTINEIVLAHSGNQFADKIDARLNGFESSLERVQTKAGKMLAQEVKEASAAIRTEIQRDIDEASLNAVNLLRRLEAAHVRSTAIPWAAIGLIIGAALFALGFWFGTHWTS